MNVYEFSTFCRYLISIGKVEEARKVLIMYSKLAGKHVDLSNVQLVVRESVSKDGRLSTRARVSRSKLTAG